MVRDYSDEKLFSLCKMYGLQAIKARNKFLGLLPEVNRRRLYEKKGFRSIFEFAYKMAGASEEQVRTILNIRRRFDDKPALRSLLENGEVSINKLARIVSVATPENQEELSVQVKLLPQKAVETLVKDMKNAGKNSIKTTDQNLNLFQTENNYRHVSESVGHPGGESEEGIDKTINDYKSLRAQTLPEENILTPGKILSMKIELNFESNTIKELHELQQKGIDINKIVQETLIKRNEEIAREKEKIVEELWQKELAAATHSNPLVNPKTGKQENLITRHIPAKVVRILRQEHGTKCAVPNCSHEAKIIHHTARFAVDQNHDPRYLAPLCQAHHLLAHAVDISFWRKRHV